jgi:hypothetical protein
MDIDDELMTSTTARRDLATRSDRAIRAATEQRRVAMVPAQYQSSYEAALALAPADETFAANLLRERREAIAGMTVVRISSQKPE